MRWLRLGFTLIRAAFKNKVSATETNSVPFTVWVTDVDRSVMNHAAMLTVMEAGRYDFMMRTNFFKVAAKNKWFFPSQAVSAQFYRPLKIFQRAEVMTKITFVDEKWIYTQHKIVRKGKVVAVSLAKNVVKKGKDTVPTSEIMRLLNIREVPTEKNKLIKMHELESLQMTALLRDDWSPA